MDIAEFVEEMIAISAEVEGGDSLSVRDIALQYYDQNPLPPGKTLEQAVKDLEPQLEYYV